MEMTVKKVYTSFSRVENIHKFGYDPRCLLISFIALSLQPMLISETIHAFLLTPAPELNGPHDWLV